MFIWYKKGNGAGKKAASRIALHYIIGVILLLAVGGILFFFSNSRKIISTEELKELAAEEGFEYSEKNGNEQSITLDGITASVIECASSEEAEKLYIQYCDSYPSEAAEDTQNIDLGDSYSKYQASGDQGILIAVRTGERLVVVRADDMTEAEAAKELFAKLVK